MSTSPQRIAQDEELERVLESLKNEAQRTELRAENGTNSTLNMEKKMCV